MNLREKYDEFIITFAKKTFTIWERLGFHVVPDHYYHPIPNLSKLQDKIWSNQSELVGIDINENEQLALLSKFSTNFKNEFESFPKEKTPIPHQYFAKNPNFGLWDGEILYCMIRYFKPSKIFEIGSGYSTFLSAQAILKNEKETGKGCTLIACEPYPLIELTKGFPGLTHIIQKNVQEIPLSEFESLKANDILFIDSSHVLKIGGDVQYEMLEIMPRLQKGVIVHIHDIFFPMEYPREWLFGEHRFWTEQYLLQAFLTFNDHFKIIWATNFMKLKHQETLKKSLHENIGTIPASMWIQKIR